MDCRSVNPGRAPRCRGSRRTWRSWRSSRSGARTASRPEKRPRTHSKEPWRGVFCRSLAARSNDDIAGLPRCTQDTDPGSGAQVLRGCWLVEDRAATEYEIQYVLNNVTELKLRASYPVMAVTRVCSVVPESGAACPSWVDSTQPIPLGHVGGYFDEIKITKPLVRF